MFQFSNTQLLPLSLSLPFNYTCFREEIVGLQPAHTNIHTLIQLILMWLKAEWLVLKAEYIAGRFRRAVEVSV